MTVGYIRPELAHLAVPIGEVAGYPGNPRKGSRDDIRASLTAHGQYTPLLVQTSSGHVVKGNNTLAVMADLGWTHVAVVRLDIDDDRARALLLVDNRTSDGADYDKAALAELLAGVVDWDAVGWTPDDLDDLIADLGDATALLDAVPATDAAYAETPDQQAARAAHTDAMSPPKAARGLAEMILVFTVDDHTEVKELIGTAKAWLGREVTAADIMLRGLRALAVIGDERHDPHAVVKVGSLLRAAGHTPDGGP